MPRYSDQQRERLRDQYLQAAADLAISQGWAAVSVRNIAGIVQKSPSPVHREGISSLKKELVIWAFAELKVALVTFMDAVPPKPLSELHASILEHLHDRPEAVRLMVQASAQVGLTGSAEAEGLSKHYLVEQKRAIIQVAYFHRKITAPSERTNIYSWAESLVRWYVAVCVTLVTDVSVTDAWLLAMAKSQNLDG